MISSFALIDYNMVRILIRGFSKKIYSKGNFYSKDTEPKIDNLNYSLLINNSLKLTLKMYWKPKLKSKKKGTESLHKYQEIAKSNTSKNWK